ncbi:glutaredoxin family protein [Ramlibacter sp.]|uniref:glutaredoxin family protein n=1 Tax=Ramlibacter sp. TaxID=1917967 RepID=UPI002D5A85F7|nr:glutaredoxin family protein [Ramlibacter sp.]HYD76247.1 glutaredoxin family protein [Ramlibacter sp.]
MTPAPLALRLAALALALAAGAAGAQQVYRIVGPDGRVTFSDKPPADVTAKVEPASAAAVSAATNGNAALPFELRQAASRYPVTLYTGPNCAPCASGRTYLSQRGIPFSEKTVTTAEDIAALDRLSGGAAALPLVTVGSQQLKGFSEAEWSQFLDAAGYPRTSRLPNGWRQPAATPLVVAQPLRAAAPTAAAEPAPAAPAPRPALPAGSNPAGIIF